MVKDPHGVTRRLLWSAPFSFSTENIFFCKSKWFFRLENHLKVFCFPHKYSKLSILLVFLSPRAWKMCFFLFSFCQQPKNSHVQHVFINFSAQKCDQIPLFCFTNFIVMSELQRYFITILCKNILYISTIRLTLLGICFWRFKVTSDVKTKSIY